MIRYQSLKKSGSDNKNMKANRQQNIDSNTNNADIISDEDLLTSYCNGDASAFDTLYLQHKDALYRFILRQCNNATNITDEIFQEVWISVINNKQQFRNESKFSTWLYQIARNKLIDNSRKSIVRNENKHDSFEAESMKSNNPEPDTKTQLEKCIELLQALVLQLPDEQKEAFVLKHDTNKSIEDLAAITETSHETFKSRLRYAMKKLREWLPSECYD